MQLWLRDYERSRHPKRSNESWISSRYNIQGKHWQELQQLYLPELNMRWGPASSALRKSWYTYESRKNECPSSQIIMSKT